MNKTILALDPSLNGTGIAVAKNGVLVHVETLVIKKLKGMERVEFILSHLKDLITSFKPDLVVIEGYSFGSRGRALFQLAELGGVIRHYLHTQGLEVVEQPPTSLKKAITGKGNANKEEMLESVNKIMKMDLKDHNQADAIGLLIMERGELSPLLLLNN